MPLIGWIGRLDHQKGPDVALDAIPGLAARGCQVIKRPLPHSVIVVHHIPYGLLVIARSHKLSSMQQAASTFNYGQQQQACHSDVA